MKVSISGHIIAPGDRLTIGTPDQEVCFAVTNITTAGLHGHIVRDGKQQESVLFSFKDLAPNFINEIRFLPDDKLSGPNEIFRQRKFYDKKPV